MRDESNARLEALRRRIYEALPEHPDPLTRVWVQPVTITREEFRVSLGRRSYTGRHATIHLTGRRGAAGSVTMFSTITNTYLPGECLWLLDAMRRVKAVLENPASLTPLAP